jgi:putative ABC transport system permease protein
MNGDPPLGARWLVRRLLPPDVSEIIEGDLEEAWGEPHVSRKRYWRLAVASIAAWWVHRGRGDARPPAAAGLPRRSGEPMKAAKAGLPRRSGEPMNAAKAGPKGDGLMRTFLQDLGYAVRLMKRAPAFTAAVVLTLAVGIGANAATFSIVNILTLKPLNYRNPERVAFLLGWNTERRQDLFNLPLSEAVDIGKQAQSLEGVAAYSYWSANLNGGGAPERIQAYHVTANTFGLLGAAAFHGRSLMLDDGRPDAPDVVVLSYGLWQRRFGGAPSVIGQRVLLDGRGHTVVGVMPARFEFPVFNFKGDAWAPLKVEIEAGVPRAASPSIVAIARLKPDVGYSQAQAELDAIMRRLEADNPATNHGLGVRAIEMRRLGAETIGPVTWIVMAAVAFVLLLACANVANLLLARAVARERELSMRAALGAARGRLVRQLLTESALLSASGAAVGIAIAFGTLRALRASLPELAITTAPNILDLGVDTLTLAYTGALGIVSALIFGIAPALRAARTDLSASLKAGAHGTAAPPHQWFRAALIVGEVAVSLVLVVAAGLLVRTFAGLHRVDPGFNSESVLTLTISLPEYRYAERDQQRRFFEEALGRVATLAGVRSAAFVNVLPFSTYNRGGRYMIEGQAPESGREPVADYRIASPDYFRTLEIPVDTGRAFDARDREGTQPVVIVNRVLARREFGNADPVGRHLRVGRRDSSAPWRTIVGVVGNVLHSEVKGHPEPEMYVPLAQAPSDMMMLAVRTAGDPDGMRDAVRSAIAAVDPTQPVYNVKTLRALLDAALMTQATAMSMMTVFGVLALLLATIGIYGVVSYAVSQQTRELGVRLALGASPGDVLRLVLRRGLSLILLGTVIGGAGALGASRLLSDALYGVTPSDAPTYAAGATLLILVGAAACYLPARRAMRLDPVVILRAE